MSKIYMKELAEGQSLMTTFLLSNVTKGVTAKGAPYLSITLADKTGTIEGKLWDVKPAQAELAVSGKVRLVDFDVIKYNNSLQVKIHNLREINEDEIMMDDYLVVSKISSNELKNTVLETVASLTNPVLKQLVEYILKEHEKDYFLYPAASRNHHNFVGGLAEHVNGMLKLGKTMCDNYPVLNRDLLLSGIILHDVGKLTELSGTLSTEYTKEGKLLGHISIMQAEISIAAEKLGLLDSEEVMLLRHMILSHHGQYEFGSPVLPMTAEAIALSFVDDADAKMNMVTKALEETKEGEFTQRIYALDNRNLYKNNLEDK